MGESDKSWGFLAAEPPTNEISRFRPPFCSIAGNEVNSQLSLSRTHFLGCRLAISLCLPPSPPVGQLRFSNF